MIVTLGLGIIAGVFLYLAFKLEDQHFFLKILALTFSLLTLLSLSSYILNNQQQCEIVLISENDTVLGSDTVKVFGYEQQCYDRPGTASTEAAFKLVNYFIRISLFYMFVFILWWLFAQKGTEMIDQVTKMMRKR